MKPISELVRRKPRPTLFTRNAEGSSSRYVAVLVVVAVTALIAVVPFAIAIFNAVAPAANVLTVMERVP